MTDLEISKALSMAIGWKDHDADPDVITVRSAYDLEPEIHCWQDGNWHRFDYRDWNVIGPIAEKFDCFPVMSCDHGDDWCIVTESIEVYAYTPQKAIALAVIGAKT